MQVWKSSVSLSALRLITLLVGPIGPLYGGEEAGEPPGANSVDADVSCVESEERFEGSEKVEYWDSGWLLEGIIEELAELGSREWVGGGLVKARAKYPGATSMPRMPVYQAWTGR